MEIVDVITAINRAWIIENLVARANTDDMPDGELRNAVLQLCREMRKELENYLAEAE